MDKFFSWAQVLEGWFPDLAVNDHRYVKIIKSYIVFPTKKKLGMHLKGILKMRTSLFHEISNFLHPHSDVL